MASRKAEMETLRSSVSEGRAKSAIVGANTDLAEMKASSEPSYEAITPQITYMMSAVANQTNPNPTKSSGCPGFKHNGTDKYSSNTFQRPKCDKKNMTCWGCGGTGHSWRECSTPRQGNTLAFRPNLPNSNPGRKAKFKWPTGGGNITLQSSSSNNQGGVHINGELRSAGAQTDSNYYNPNPWARILGRANETDVEIDGVISKALIDSGAMISMMSTDYCYEYRYVIQLLEHLVPIEGSGRASVPYLGYVGVRMYIPVITSFDGDILMLVSPTTTRYHERVLIQVGSLVIDQVTSCISEEELQSLSQSWKMVYVSTIILKATSVSEPNFDLDNVRGRVVISEEVTIPASQITVVKGLTMITGHHKCVHVLGESSHKCMSEFCSEEYFQIETWQFLHRSSNSK